MEATSQCAAISSAVQHLGATTRCESVVAWALREDGSPYVAAARFDRTPPRSPDAQAFEALACLRTATDLAASELPAAVRELEERFGCRAAVPICSSEGRPLAALLLGGISEALGGPPSRTRPTANPRRIGECGAAPGGASGGGAGRRSTEPPRRGGATPRPPRRPRCSVGRDRPRSPEPAGLGQDLSPAASRAWKGSRVPDRVPRSRNPRGLAHGASARRHARPRTAGFRNLDPGVGRRPGARDGRRSPPPSRPRA